MSDYLDRSPRSAELMRRSFAVVAGGVSRSFGFHIPYPVVNRSGAGAHIQDADGNDYLDFVYNGMSLIHGHGFAPVVEVVSAQMREGWAWPGSNEAQIEFAELLCARLTGVDQVRFTNSGSEATMLAVKIARRKTGRQLILKARGAYHGSFADLEAGLHGNGAIAGSTLVCEFGDTQAFLDMIRRHAGELAAVIVEPVLITGGVVAPPDGFLAAVFAAARQAGVLTILDDCLMMRLAPGGSGEFFGLEPDLIALGKFIGGGIPMGAVCGGREIMRVFAPEEGRPLYHGGSFNGNVIAARAGAVTMAHLSPAAIARMTAQAADIRRFLDDRIAARHLAARTSGVGSVVGIAFDGAEEAGQDYYAKPGRDLAFHLACALSGLQIGAGGFLAMSTALTDEDLLAAKARLDGALARLETSTVGSMPAGDARIERSF